MSYQLFCFIFTILTSVNAHPQQTTYNEDDCTCEPGAKAFESYHIHVLFYPDLPSSEFGNNTHASKYARVLRHKFVEYFDVSDCAEGNIFDQGKLCTFAVDETGACGLRNSAPFVVPNFVIFLPVDRYAEVVPWMMANRGDLDFLLHPNTCGFKCSPKDHLLWSMWAGDKWPVRFQDLDSMSKH